MELPIRTTNKSLQIINISEQTTILRKIVAALNYIKNGAILLQMG
jgi:hypothetical protein